MRITKKKIQASVKVSASIPYPFNQFYELVDDQVVEDETGWPAHPSPCEECEGYDITFLGYAYPKPGFEQELSDMGVDRVELIREKDGEPFLGYVVHDRIYRVNETDMPDSTSYEEYEEAGYLDDVDACSDVTGAVDTGLEYWYFSRHGFGPGTIPKDVTVLDWYEEGYKTWMLLNKMLTTAELNEYELKEEAPPEGAITHNGETIKGSCDIKASEDDDFDDDWDEWDEIGYDHSADVIVPIIEDTLEVNEEIASTIYSWYDAEDIWEDFDSADDFAHFLRSDIYAMLDACDDEDEKSQVLEAIEGTTCIEGGNRVQQLEELSERLPFGKGAGKRNRSVFYRGYKIVLDAINKFWEIRDRANNFIKGAFLDKDDAIAYIQDNLVAASTETEGEPIVASECTKVAEDDDSIEYVVSSEDVEGMSLIRYGDYKVVSSPDHGWEVLDKENNLVERGFSSELEARTYIKEVLGVSIKGAEDVDSDESDSFLEQPDQEFTSKDTAVNGKQGKLPAVFKKATIPQGALVLDYGGGTVESEEVAQNFLNQFNATEMLYDPFNQTAEHNRDVIKALKNNGGADVAVCSNVLNVIKEQDVRLDVINKINKLLKSGATAYITVYEGGGHGAGTATQKGKSYQNNQKLETYLEEVQTAFPNAVRKGSVIIAPKTQESLVAAIDIDAIDFEALKRELEEGCEAYLTGPQGGFLPSGSPKEDRWDITADEIYLVEVERVPDPDRIKCEVRAELDYDGLENLIEYLNPIVEAYDEDAYFDIEDAGIINAYIEGIEGIDGATDIEAGKWDSYNERMLDRHDRDITRVPEDEEIEEKEDVHVKFNFEGDVIVEEDGEWRFEDPDAAYLSHIDDYSDEGITEDQIDEDFIGLVLWHIPDATGKYHIKGLADIIYTFDDDYPVYSKYSAIRDFTSYPAGKVESSTKIEAASSSMTKEELEDAILQGRPFTLADFKKYNNVNDPDSILAKDVEVGDVIDVEEDASEVNLGTVVKVLAINEPNEEVDWADYTFRVEVIDLIGRAGVDTLLDIGDVIFLHFDAEDAIGPLLAM